jgi:midasin (ATPase involved in ribosome maturation)
MREGRWILLDGVESAPHEVEKLMLLLDGNPSLYIFESDRYFFHTQKFKDHVFFD